MHRYACKWMSFREHLGYGAAGGSPASDLLSPEPDWELDGRHCAHGIFRYGSIY